MARPARLEQVTIALTPELRAFVAHCAQRETRTVAAQIRHFVVEAARRNGTPAAEVLTPLPVRPQINNPEDLAAAKARHGAMEREREELEGTDKRRRRNGLLGLLPDDDNRLRNIRGEIYTLGKEIEQAKIKLGSAAS